MIYPNQLLCSYHPHPNPPFPTAELRLRCMKSIGNRCISFFTRTCVVNRTSRKLIKASTHVPFPRKATWTINSVWKGSPDPAFPLVFHENLASRASVIRLSRIAFSFHTQFRTQIQANSTQVAVKSRIPLTFPESYTLIQPNPGSPDYPSTR